METKISIRKKALMLRGELSKEQRFLYSRQISDKLVSLSSYKNADIVLGFVGYGSEIDTIPFLEQARADGKQVFCPVSYEDGTMQFYRYDGKDSLAEGYKGIPEPKERQNIFSPEENHTKKVFLLMPGVAFDKEGHRIGYGKGFYDRYFCNYKPDASVAVCYSCQIFSQIPHEPHDIRASLIITEDTTMDLMEMGQKAVAAKYKLQNLTEIEKNNALMAVANALEEDCEPILSANAIDIKTGEEKGMHSGMIDRLRLTKDRIKAIADGLREIVELPDCLDEEIETFERPNGLKISKVRVPLGVIGIIYESRPNVTADAFGLCFKTGNAVILKGGSDAIHSNKAITESIRKALASCDITEDAVQLITDTNRETTTAFMKMNEYVDVLIPRGSAGLIRAVVENSTIPVIETGTGNCHVFVDESADLDKAIAIIVNAKTQRIGVCNACESLIIHENIKERFLPRLSAALKEKNVEMRGDEAVCELISDCIPATEEDYGKEYLDYIISMKTVSNVEEAIAHINKYGTKHSEAIVTCNEENATKFKHGVDAACVYVNASTRFTDGFEFGFGAEIGISTQKLHARGPMGLKELTTYKYTIVGDGQIR